MKNRIFSMLLITTLLAALLPLAAQADDDAFLGLWVDTDNYADASYQNITAIFIRPNGRAFFVDDTFYDSSTETYPDNRIYNWTVDGNKLSLLDPDTGKVFWELYLFENEQRYLSFFDDGRFVRFQHVPYIAVPSSSPAADAQAPSEETEAADRKGTSVPQGEYLVGRDIPAGAYRIEFLDNNADMFIYDSADSTFYSAYIAVSKFYPEYARIELKEGNIVKILFGPLLMTEPSSLEFNW